MCNSYFQCEFDRQCRDCYLNPAKRLRGNTKTGIPTDDMKAYKREYMRRRREAEMQREMQAAGVA